MPDNTILHYSYNEQGQLSGISYQQNDPSYNNGKSDNSDIRDKSGNSDKNDKSDNSELNTEKNNENTQSLITRQYHNAGLLIHQFLGNGIELTQTFDVLSRVTQQQWQIKQQVSPIEQIQRNSIPNNSHHAYGEVRTYQYDNKHQLLNVNTLKTCQGYEKNATEQQAFSYNSISQLLNANKTKVTTTTEQAKATEQANNTSETEHYQWDAFGNPVDSNSSCNTSDLTNKQNANETEKPKQLTNNILVENDRLLSFLGTDYRYDNSGNQLTSLAKGEQQQRSFNGLNQLKSININGQLTHYEYDALGRRSAKITEQGRTDFIWDENQVIGEHSKGQFTWYIYAPHSFEPIALIKSANPTKATNTTKDNKTNTSNTNNEVYYYHLDQLGTPLCITNSKAKQVWRNISDAFGYQQENKYANTQGIDRRNAGNTSTNNSIDINNNTSANANTNADTSTDTTKHIVERRNTLQNPLRFQGQYFDEESKLHYNRFRYYCPKQQRFIHQDPIGLVGGINHYQYAPNPVNWVDPFGLMCKEGGDGLAMNTVYFVGGVTKQVGDTVTGTVEAIVDDPLGVGYDALSTVADAVFYPIDYVTRPFGLTTGAVDRTINRVNGTINDVGNFTDEIANNWACNNWQGLGGSLAAIPMAVSPRSIVKPKLDIPNSKLQFINGKPPRNGEFAGKNYALDVDKNPILKARLETMKPLQRKIREKKLNQLANKYPEGVNFTDKGFPDFNPYVIKHNGNPVEVDINRFNPNPQSGGTSGSQLDMNDANAMMTTKDSSWNQPAGTTWHHVENSTTMQLLPTDLHSVIGHSGGRSTYTF